MELTLLGTGMPFPSPDRAGPSQHLQLGKASVLVDCGNGTCRRMVEAGLEPKEIDLIFVTHMHSDHTIDLAHVLISGWIAYRSKPVKIIGPPQTREFVRRVLHAFEFDIKLRKLEERVGGAIMAVEVVEIGDGDTFAGDGWEASAMEVDHGYVKPSLGFIFEEAGKKLVISGDTAPCQAVVDAARGADVLVHELTRGRKDADFHGSELEQLPPLRRRILESHTCPHQLGPLAQESGVPGLVLTHLPHDLDEEWAREVITADYNGQLIVGHDLLRMTV